MSNDNSTFKEACFLVIKYLNFNLIASNIDNIEVIIEEGVDEIEVENDQIEIHGLDFSHGFLPIISATAIFSIPLKDDFDPNTLED